MVMSDIHQAKEFAKAGEEGSGLVLAYELVLLKLLKIAPKEGKALDIACGSGVLLSRIAGELPDMNFTGIDFSDNMLEIAERTLKREQISNVRLKKLDMFTIDTEFEPNSFDLITFNFALHHLSTAEQVIELINKMHALLKKDGVLFIYDLARPKTDQTAVWLANRFSSKSGPYFYQDALNSYRAAFSFSEVEQMLEKTNWRGYEHIEPPVGNFFQYVYSQKKGRQHKTRLKTFEDKMSFFLFKTLPFVKG